MIAWRCLLVSMLMTILPSVGVADNVDFNRDVLPILSTSCFPCHGPDPSKRKADLRLDLREESVGEDASGVIVPGQAAKSELIIRLQAEDRDGRMPPPKSGSRLKPEQLRILSDWINQGAEYTEHWAFVPPKRLPLPKVQDSNWPQTSIDYFVLKSLEEKKLQPAPKASKEVLIRRVTLDLIGLPPTPEEIESFLKDTSPNAYEKLINRLLDSPAYGERWGRHWLDVARYADSGGFETDIFFGSAWRYRDYVIRSFNDDKPFDQFVKEQIAGDELFPNNREALVATSLYTIGPVLQEADMVKGKLDYDWLTDSVDTTGSAFLGLTIGCARCHDHKYDPISQIDYFGLQAIFSGSDLTDFKTDGSYLRDHVALKKTEKEFEEARKKRAPTKNPQDYDEFPEIPLRGLGPRSKAKMIEVHLLNRGELSHPGELVRPQLPSKFITSKNGVDNSEPKRTRTMMANWVASKQNPLTARVMVNRVWQWHFGEGLVRTPNDFGIRGDRPTHPELLDQLATEFMEKNWSLKHLHRTILLSNSYQMSSEASSKTLQLDPDNLLLTRFQPRRVEAEIVWDSMRMIAGTLDRKMFGLPIFPPLDERELIGNYKKWPANSADEANRRAVYIVARRSFRFPALGAFDPPENVSSCGQRDCTVVPNQALTLLNSRSVREQANAFTERLLRETDGTWEQIVERVWLHAYGRKVTSDECKEAIAFLQDREKVAPMESSNRRRTAIKELCIAIFNTNEFIYLP